uniref:(northern house mosquito) hypothetical protein n=1 Tax=Culex pipiens TaxID=7175 RepID=A0A8D8E4S1_CULPI
MGRQEGGLVPSENGDPHRSAGSFHERNHPGHPGDQDVRLGAQLQPHGGLDPAPRGGRNPRNALHPGRPALVQPGVATVDFPEFGRLLLLWQCVHRQEGVHHHVVL